MHSDAVEIVPAQTADSAISVSLASKVELSKWQRRKLRNRARRKQSDGDPPATHIRTCDTRDTFQQDAGFGRKRAFADDYSGFLEVGGRKRSAQHSQL